MQEYQARVFNTALNLLQHHGDAEEITQDVFVEAYTKQEQFKGDAAISTWLYRITVNKCIDLLRKKERKKLWMLSLKKDTGAGEPADFVHPGVVAEQKEKAALLYKALMQLPLNQRAAYLLYETEQLSYQAISEVLGTSVPAVESLLFRARQNLRKIIGIYYQQ